LPKRRGRKAFLVTKGQRPAGPVIFSRFGAGTAASAAFPLRQKSIPVSGLRVCDEIL